MNITQFSIERPSVTWLAVALIFVGGLLSYQQLGKLEDPEFTIKTAVVVTHYSGASPTQVEKEVTEIIELAVQEIPEIDYVESLSRAGLSIVKVEIESRYWSEDLPQIWDTLRRKIRNVEEDLPIGVTRPDVLDDFGDVYGFVIAITGDGYNYKDIEYYAEELKRSLSMVEDVSRVELWGKRQRAIFLDISESQLAELGITVSDIARALNQQNNQIASGNIYHNEKVSRIEITGDFNSIDDISNTVISSRLISNRNEILTLRDIASVNEGFIEPSLQTLRYNGQEAMGLAVSNIPGSNIVDLGKRLENKLNALEVDIPIGIEAHKISWQANEVNSAINSFLVSLLQAVLIVLLVLTFTMGWRMGVIIGTALVLTILGTLIIMLILGIDLQRISLGALVISMGMMVDNSIVVGDGILVRMRKGISKTQAAIEAAKGPSLPLLGATLIAVLAFYPIGGSTENVGEYCLSLFQVVGISLFFSWIISMTVTPLQCMLMLKKDDKTTTKDEYKTGFYTTYRTGLERALRHQFVTICILITLLLTSIWGFQFVSEMFFPSSTRAQFMVDMYASTGTRLQQSSETLRRAESHVMTLEGVESVSSFIGSGPPRFYLPVESEFFYPSYGQLIVNVNDHSKIDLIAEQLRPWLVENFPEVPTFRIRKYAIGPGGAWKFELRIIAPESAKLSEIRTIAEEGLTLLKGHPMVQEARLDWRELSPKVVLEFDQNEGNWSTLSRNDVSSATQRAFDGLPVAEFRDGQDLLPIMIRNKSSEREDPSSLYNIQIPQPYTGRTVPLTQVTDSISLAFEDPIIWRRDRQRVITIQAEPITGVTLPELREDLLGEIEMFENNLTDGYTMEWGGETESSAESQASLIPGMIPAVTLMFFIIVLLFNEFKPAVIIFLTIPFIVVGITVGLLVTGADFGFMALLGVLSLMGMMVKNSIVLIDEVKINKEKRNQENYAALVNAGISRIRPVALAATTTALGVIPLLQDVFWQSMSITIMAGLIFGTAFTMIIVPVLYALFYGIQKPDALTYSRLQN